MKLSKFISAALVLFSAATALAQVPGVKHVVIEDKNKKKPEKKHKTQTPVMRRMMREGSFTLHGRGVMPTDSSTNWASMIMGAGPEQQGVTSNDWETFW